MVECFVLQAQRTIKHPKLLTTTIIDQSGYLPVLDSSRQIRINVGWAVPTDHYRFNNMN
jgi:hypothetical protein